ncbi:MAG: ABC transporter ATP-binding protein, partial [Candidatus Sulfotelmatobacter sp.]
LNPIKRRKMEDRIRELEAEISRAETLIAQYETSLQDFVSADESQRQSMELERQKTAHAAFLEEWEDLSESLQDAV